MKKIPIRNARTHVNNCHVYSWAYKPSCSARMAIRYLSFHSKCYIHFHLFQTDSMCTDTLMRILSPAVPLG